MRRLAIPLGVLILAGSAWLSGRADRAGGAPPAWVEVAPAVWRSPGSPAGYALVDGPRALLIDAPGATLPPGVTQVELALLTHHHRDTAAAVGALRAGGVTVRAPKESAPWLTPEGVAKYWKDALPLRNSRTAYLVLPAVPAGIDCSLAGGDVVPWHGWTITAVATPGHSADHLAYLARRGKDGPPILFAGDAVAAAGTIWSPYTTDWDHWTDAGLKPTAASLRKLAALDPAPSLILPAHGELLRKDGVRALEKAATAIDEVAFLKSFEHYTKERLKDPPAYSFLVKEQAGSNGSKAWSRVAPSLWLTGNTYVLVSKSGACLVVDPWDPHSAKQIPKLQADAKLGRAEVVLCSHAHYDHYDGAYGLLERDRPEVWTLDRVALPVAEPFLLRHPFLDARALKIDRRAKDGETLRWREYDLKFRFLPGQTEFTMGVETTIDGKRCFFTADNFFHHDLYSGTGGWMGLNRSGPLLYAESARKVLAARPDWVLGEHGSAMEFSAEDFRRRVAWGEAGAKAADAVCATGEHRHDWNPHRVRVEPVLLTARAGATLKATLAVDNPLPRARKLSVRLDGRGVVGDGEWAVEVPAGGSARRAVELKLGEKVGTGRQVFQLVAREGDVTDPADAIVAVDVE